METFESSDKGEEPVLVSLRQQLGPDNQLRSPDGPGSAPVQAGAEPGFG